MDFNLIYATAANRDQALEIARILVGERLVACANVLGGAASVYWWEGKVEEGGEAVLICKTRSDLVEAVTQRITQSHSYACPCVVAVPLTGGNPAFLAWIAAETRST